MITLPRRVLGFDRPLVVAVVNVTPDSFSDGGIHCRPPDAIAFGQMALAAGADVLDIGGESTRPGAEPVSLAEELARTIPVIRALAETVQCPLSIDTTKAEVAEAALDAGAEIVNDISGGTFDERMVEVVARRHAGYVCGHLRGRTIAEAHAAAEQHT
ncbi:MAG: dihydropteroate synthase, partial [Pseudomonadota bacterium]